jgi:hypothetical protein
MEEIRIVFRVRFKILPLLHQRVAADRMHSVEGGGPLSTRYRSHLLEDEDSQASFTVGNGDKPVALHIRY